MVPLDLDALGAAYWTGNGHKWLCGPKGSAVLWVRADRRERIHPLVVSHGANEPVTDRSRFRAEFDWTGTTDPTAYLALPAAIALLGASAEDEGGWPAVMAANHALALTGRDRIASALGVEPPAPGSMLGSMAALPVPGLRDDSAAEALREQLEREDGIQVPIGGWPVRAARTADDPEQVLIRISAQLYNEAADYDRLAAALVRRLRRR
jgi:isopenicillin-N epimerase